MPNALLEAPRASGAHDDVVRRISQDMAKRWQTGERPSASDYLHRYPELANDRNLLLRLIYEEIYLYEEHGITSNADDLCRAFPELHDEVAALCFFHRLLSA